MKVIGLRFGFNLISSGCVVTLHVACFDRKLVDVEVEYKDKTAHLS